MWEGDGVRSAAPTWHQLLVPAGIDEAALRQLARRRRYARGEIVFHEGDPAGSLHLVDRGRLAVRVSTPLGDVAVVDVLRAGDCFGEQALIEPGADRSATVAAIEKAETLSIDLATCETLRQATAGFDRFLLAVVNARLRSTTQQLLEALYVPADVRVFRCLCRLVELFAGDVVPLTQADVGTMTGVTRSTVSRLLARAQDDAVISVSRGRIHVLDASGLRRRAHLAGAGSIAASGGSARG